MSMKSYTGIVLYEGPSLINGQQIVAIATLHSENEKTGDMVQTWILFADLPPKKAVDIGLDEAVCGQCIHRHHTGGACYVIPWQGPNNVYKAWQRGNYPVATRRHINRLRGRAIRFGSYGDPAAVPARVWRQLQDVASFTTGYVHQHGSEEHLDFCMISADSEQEAVRHQDKGLRTFRVKSEDEPLLDGEVLCPASKSDEVQCIDCGICDGASRPGANVAIDVHGARKKRYNLIAKQVA